jgi:dihydropyrimidinase
VDTVIRNGIIVTASDIYRADVAISDGVISTIGHTIEPTSATEIDATGCYVIPGGIDVHTHLETPSFGAVSVDDFLTGTRAAAWGGTTTIIDFCPQEHGKSLTDALDEWHRHATGNAAVDYGFHSIVVDPSPVVLEELRHLPAQGIPTFKIFLAYRGMSMVDDLALARIMDIACESGAMVMVHAENGDVVYHRQRTLLAQGHTEPKYHAVSRPPRVEAEATARAIALAELSGASLYIVHVSCQEALEEVRRGRERGVKVWAETCPQYLFTSEEDLDRPDFEGAKYVFTPPPRHRHNQAALWQALADGTLQVISSDHSPWNFRGHKDLGRDDFTKIPNGGHGIEERLMLTYQGVEQGFLTLSRFVDITATSPAKIFGLYPKKGTIAIGSDADLVLWDPQAELTLSSQSHHSALDYSMYEGLSIRGVPRTVLLRGTPIISNRNLAATEPRGEFLSRILAKC